MSIRLSGTLEQRGVTPIRVTGEVIETGLTLAYNNTMRAILHDADGGEYVVECDYLFGETDGPILGSVVGRDGLEAFLDLA